MNIPNNVFKQMTQEEQIDLLCLSGGPGTYVNGEMVVYMGVNQLAKLVQKEDELIQKYGTQEQKAENLAEQAEKPYLRFKTAEERRAYSPPKIYPEAPETVDEAKPGLLHWIRQASTSNE